MFNDVFGSSTLPPSEYGVASYSLSGLCLFSWPYNTSGSGYVMAKILEVAVSTDPLTDQMQLPRASEVSPGEDFLIRNSGGYPLTVRDYSGVQVAYLTPGQATYLYLMDNSTDAGQYHSISFGVGTSTQDASTLIGYGVKAIGATLNQSHPAQIYSSGVTVDSSHRAQLLVSTGGSETFPLSSAVSLGDDFFFLFRNQGSGTVKLIPDTLETLDGLAELQVQPGESLMLVCTGSSWFSVGYGRSPLYLFTQLTKDVSAGGTITLTATEASNRLMTFIGNPSTAVEVVVPELVAIYYTQNAISTSQTVTLKTGSGSGVSLSQGARIIAMCDGTNVVSAQSTVSNTILALEDGSAILPSLNFSSHTNTGLYKSGTQDLGVAVNGASVGVFGTSGLQSSTLGPDASRRHILPVVASDTFALLNATQTLINKTFNLSNNSLSGTKAQFNAACSDGDFVYSGTAITQGSSGEMVLNSSAGTSGQVAISQGPGMPSVWGTITVPSGMLFASNNLSDLANATTARGNLGLGNAATLTAGTGANNLVQLDGTGKLPALNALALTNLSAGNLTGTLPSLDAAALTDLNASNITSGTVAAARLGSGTPSSSTVLLGDNTWGPIPAPYAGMQILSTAGTGTVTVLSPNARVTVIGGAGGGGGVGGVGNFRGGGGGVGGFAIKYISGLTVGSTISYTVGAGGSGGTNAPTAGTAGGTTSFGSYVSATGGGGGASNNGAQGTSGTGVSGDFNSGIVTAAASGAGGYFTYGIEIILNVPKYTSIGGAAPSIPTSYGNNGNPGSGISAGGSGGASKDWSAAGGAGTSGLIIIEWGL